MSCQENEEHRHAGVTDRTQRDDGRQHKLLVLYLPVSLAASGQMTASPERMYLSVMCMKERYRSGCLPVPGVNAKICVLKSKKHMTAS